MTQGGPAGPVPQRTDLGRRGEDAAAEYLRARGMHVLARNWRCRWGEIDLIAREGEVLVFCEVKTRSGIGYGPPLGAITGQKVARLRRLVGYWLAEDPQPHRSIRIDAIGIVWRRGDLLEVQHVRGVA